MTNILSILAALIVLSFIVTVHEFGHYIAGRKLGFTILEFAIGMGPVLLKTTKGGIQYSLRAFPIGGMCRFFGEDEAAADTRSFNAQKVWKRMIVVTAGALMNFVFAVLVSIITLSTYGDYVPEICEIPNATSPAAIGGLMVGDTITAVDGKSVQFYSDTVPYIQSADGESLVVTVDRAGKSVDCTLKDFHSSETGGVVIGIMITPVRAQFGFFKAVARSFGYIGSTYRETFAFFGRLLQGNVQSTDAGGPVAIVAYISEAVRYSLESVLRMMIFISISLGIMNLLPLPALDGGRFAFMLVEAIRGKPVPAEKEGMVHFVGIILLFGLIIFLTYNDIANLVKGLL